VTFRTGGILNIILKLCLGLMRHSGELFLKAFQVYLDPHSFGWGWKTLSYSSQVGWGSGWKESLSVKASSSKWDLITKQISDSNRLQ